VLGVEGGGDILVGSLVIHVLPHAGDVSSLLLAGLLDIEGLLLLPSSTVGEEVGFAVVSDSHDLGLGGEDNSGEGEDLELETGDVSRVEIDHREAGILSNEAQEVSRGREGDILHPRVAVVFRENGSEFLQFSLGKAFGGGGSLLVDSLGPCRNDTAFIVRGSGGHEDVVGMPLDGENSAFVLLDVLGDPPVVGFFEIADGNDLGSSSNSEFVLKRGPFNSGSATIETKNDESGLPFASFEGPHIGISVLRARKDSILLSPIKASHDLGMLIEGMLEVPIVSLLAIDLDDVVIGAKGDLCLISIP